MGVGKIKKQEVNMSDFLSPKDLDISKIDKNILQTNPVWPELWPYVQYRRASIEVR